MRRCAVLLLASLSTGCQLWSANIDYLFGKEPSEE